MSIKKLFLLGTLAVLSITALPFAALAAANPDDARLEITVDPDQAVTVTGKRQKEVQGWNTNISFKKSGSKYVNTTKVQVASSLPDGNPARNTFDIEIKNAAGAVIGKTDLRPSQNNNWTASKTVKVAAPTQTAKLGSLSGKLEYIDPRDKKTYPYKKPCTITLTSEDKKKTYESLNCDNNGNYSFPQTIILGKYSISATYMPPSQAGVQAFPAPVINGSVDIKAGANTFNGSNADQFVKPDPAATDASAENEGENACADASGTYAWLLCPAVNKATEFLNAAYDQFIQPLLIINPLTQKDPNGKDNGIFAVWKAFVSLANVLFVLAFIGIIFGTVLNLDAYTVKKALPRLVIAAIAVQLSFFFCAILIDISNIFGSGLLDFIKDAIPKTANEGDAEVAKSLISYSIGILGVVAFGAALFLGPAAALLLLGFVISVFVFIVTLLIRQFLITILIILAPVAIVAWIMPNTEGLFKKWKDNFLKLLFIYPIISVLLGVAYVVQAASAADGVSTVGQIAGGIAPMLAFFMMPAVFKMSGKAMGLAGGAIAGVGALAGKKGADRTKQAYDNSALIKQRKEKQLMKNLDTAQGTGLLARRARSKAGLGFARTAGSQMEGFNKLQQLEKSKEAGSARQLQSATADDLLKVAQTQEGKEAVLASGQKVLVTKAHQKAAVAKAAASIDRDGSAGLERIKTAMEASGQGELFSAAVRESGHEAKVLEKAPHLAGKDISGGLSADKIASLDSNGLSHFLDNASALSNSSAAIEQLRNSDSLKGRMSAANQASLFGAVGSDGKSDLQVSRESEITQTTAASAQRQVDEAATFAADDAKMNTLLDEHVAHLASQGQVVSRDDLADRMGTDPSFAHQVRTANMNGVPIKDITPIPGL